MPTHLAMEMTFESAPGHDNDGDFETFLDEVIVQFDHIGREVNLAARIAERAADFSVTVEAETFEDAVTAFLNDTRTALHAAGCVTAGWPDPPFKPQSRVVRELLDV